MGLVGGDLEDRVRRGVDDRLAAFDMRLAQRFEDRHARRLAVAEHAGQVGAFDQCLQQVGRKAVLALVEVAPFEQRRNAGDLPVPGGGVLAGGDFSGAGVSPFDDFGHVDARRPLAGAQVVSMIEAQPGQVG